MAESKGGEMGTSATVPAIKIKLKKRVPTNSLKDEKSMQRKTQERKIKDDKFVE